jgi:hypothetical protein
MKTMPRQFKVAFFSSTTRGTKRIPTPFTVAPPLISIAGAPSSITVTFGASGVPYVCVPEVILEVIRRLFVLGKVAMR